jgi:hypothetical protein
MAVPCFSSGKASSRTPWLHGWSPPPASPWITRNRIIWPRLVAKPHSAEARVKTAMESRK